MTTLDFAGRAILPQPRAFRRNSGRGRAAAVPTLRAVPTRRRGVVPAARSLESEQVYTWLLQGSICAAMAGMLLYFHAPLSEALRALL
ncbi:MAG: hypothetical protein P4L83_08765 [Nevskia sp.]|nr:hypothetical protein [Nevskia sp.]